MLHMLHIADGRTHSPRAQVDMRFKFLSLPLQLYTDSFVRSFDTTVQQQRGWLELILFAYAFVHFLYPRKK